MNKIKSGRNYRAWVAAGAVIIAALIAIIPAVFSKKDTIVIENKPVFVAPQVQAESNVPQSAKTTKQKNQSNVTAPDNVVKQSDPIKSNKLAVDTTGSPAQQTVQNKISDCEKNNTGNLQIINPTTSEVYVKISQPGNIIISASVKPGDVKNIFNKPAGVYTYGVFYTGQKINPDRGELMINPCATESFRIK